MLSVINPNNYAATEISEWGSSGYANSDNGLYPDQLKSVSEDKRCVHEHGVKPNISAFSSPFMDLFLSTL